MAEIGKVTPGHPVIPPVPQDRPVAEREHEEREQRRREQSENDGDMPDEDENGEDGIDVYV